MNLILQYIILADIGDLLGYCKIDLTAMDGSFRIAFELERFISRRPRLASVPEFDYLLKKVMLFVSVSIVKLCPTMEL